MPCSGCSALHGVKPNQKKSVYNLNSESTVLMKKKLAEQTNKIHELEENTEDQVNRNSRDRLVITGIKKAKLSENME